MKILVCSKIVLDEEELKFNASGELEHTSAYKISNFDLCAIECALAIKAKNADAQIIGVCVGDKLNSKLSKDLLSRGLDELVNLKTSADDSISAAHTISEYAKSVDAKIIIAGTNSSDLFQGVLAPYLAAKLDAAYIDSVSAIDAISEQIDVKASTPVGEYTIKADLPVVMSANPEYFEAKIPGMKAILQAAKKPCNEVQAAPAQAKFSVLSTLAPKAKDRAKVIYEMKDLASFKAELEKLV